MGDWYFDGFMVEKQEAFLQELLSFHAAVGTPLVRLPRINGTKDLDLLTLYKTVTGMGGWEKVSDTDKWGDVAERLGLPQGCLNGSVALKQVYLRYLDKYEKMHFVRKVRGGIDDEVETNIVRLNRLSARSLHTTPMTYKHEQHMVSFEQRYQYGLTTQLFQPSRFEKLLLSLISPLPNEQDFSINVCAIFSLNQKCHHMLRDCAKISQYLMAHAAVFRDEQLRAFFLELYEKDRGNEIHNFWRDIVKHDSLSWLADEGNFYDPDSEEETDRSGPTDGYLDKTPHDQHYLLHRATQIAKIFMNFTFDPLNVQFLLNDVTYLRFVLLCCDAKFTSLSEIGWNMLSNLAPKLEFLKIGLTREIIFLLTEGVCSDDVSLVLSALKVGAELAKSNRNTAPLAEFLKNNIYLKIKELLTVEDVVLILHALELLYAVSYLGESFCESIAKNGLVNIVVLLLTFRPRNLLNFEGAWQRIKFVETIETVYEAVEPTNFCRPPPPPQNTAQKLRNALLNRMQPQPVPAQPVPHSPAHQVHRMMNGTFKPPEEPLNGLTIRSTPLDFVGFDQAPSGSGPDDPSHRLQSRLIRYSRPSGLYLCEWRACLRKFATPTEVFSHICRVHCSPELKESQPNLKCRWGLCTESPSAYQPLMKHIYTAHCHPSVIRNLNRRPIKNHISVPYRPPPPPQPPRPPPIDVEDPLSKSIKITASVVLRNLALHSPLARRLLLPFESQIASMAFTCPDLSKFLAEALSHLKPETK